MLPIGHIYSNSRIRLQLTVAVIAICSSNASAHAVVSGSIFLDLLIWLLYVPLFLSAILIFISIAIGRWKQVVLVVLGTFVWMLLTYSMLFLGDPEASLVIRRVGIGMAVLTFWLPPVALLIGILLSRYSASNSNAPNSSESKLRP
jgi:hypothetical protein